MVRPPREFVEAAKGYVCVRVLNMSGVDLNLFTFDYDLTLAVLLMNADGTIYHRYGGRDWKDATARLSMKGLVRVMSETLEDHRGHAKAPEPRTKRTIMDIEPYAKRLRAQKTECIHCHMVNEAERELARQEKKWSADAIWMYPLPDRIGLSLDRDDPTLVAATEGPSAKAGLKKGDRLVRVGDARVRSESDVQWALHHAPDGATTIKVECEGKTAAVSLAKGWKVATPLEISWRPYMWGMKPQPGFGGRALKGPELTKLGLKADAFAFRIEYIVDWGDDAATGRNAMKAGLKKGDVVVSAAGKSDFKNELHFQAWFRLTQKAGAKVDFGVLRGGKSMTITMDVLP